jgi:arabinose-5-phosphate isomerase
MHVADLMHSGDAVPRVDLGARVPEMLREMTSKGFGFTAVTDAGGGIAGIFTDGDLRRLIETGADLRGLTASEVMHCPAEADSRGGAGGGGGRPDGAASHHRPDRRRRRGPARRVLNSNDLMRAKVI